MSTRVLAVSATIVLAAAIVIVGAPLSGWVRVVRLPAVLVPALLLALAGTRPWKVPNFEERAAAWVPSPRIVAASAVVLGLLIFWCVLTRFQSGQINAIDFTIYYDRPCFQTVQGRPLFVEISDTPHLSQRSELGDHGYWGMLAVCSLYAIHPTPMWLHAISALAVLTGALLVLRIVLLLGGGGIVASAAALAFLLNDNTARALNYGFHPEVFYTCFVPWMLDAGLRRRPRQFLAAVVACVLVKEDACLPVFAATVALALNRFRVMSIRERLFFLGLPNVLALANLAVYYGLVLPVLTEGTRPMYAHFWVHYGDTPMRALVGMCRQPGRVVRGTLSSGIFRTLQPFLFLPLVGWRWTLGIVPIVALYGASANEQLRAFGIYYALIFVPLLSIAAAMGALTVARRLTPKPGYVQVLAGSALLLGALLVGSGNRGYSLRPWKPEVAAVKEALSALSGEPTVLVQSGLFPHAGYESRTLLLTRETLRDPRNAGSVLLLAPQVGAYPFSKPELAPLLVLPRVRALPAGLVAVRLANR